MRSWAAITAAVLACSCHAQLLTDAGAAITITAGTQLTVKGDVLATTGATVANAGNIDLSGNLTNNSGGQLFAPVAGTVIMNGATQTIDGTSVAAFDGLDLQCASLGLQQDVVVGGTYPAPAGVLQLRDAVVQLNTHRITVSNGASTAITRLNGQMVSESDPLTGYGEVEWHIGANTGNYKVPFGNGSAYLPVVLAISSAGTGPGTFIFATYPTDPFGAPNNRPLPTGMTVFTDLAGNENAHNVVDRFWPITTNGYTTAPTAILNFNYQDSEWNSGTNTIVEAALQAQHFNGSVWSQPPNGIVNTVQNVVITASTSSFDFVWALVQSSTPLPVELLHFDARPEEAEVLCTWATATETNNDFFTVERSADGETFSDIGEVDGAGQSQTTLAYAFSDDAPLDGLSYYRLRQTDFDGTETWSQAVAVWRGAPASELVLYPNPCGDELFFAGGSLPEERASILDATGRVVVDRATLAGARIDVSTLLSGSYIVQLSTEGGRRSARFLKR
ncbi:MAG: T9SS type A sorting domain-containing protein [Flavobacteriales bacterium]|nr:MAG: T9SS type A sorting domain-containing protein [Flavobacteriales bacterium]